MSLEFFNHKKLFAREQVTVSTASIGGTAATYNGQATGETTQREQPAVGAIHSSGNPARFRASAAIVELITNDIFYTIDGSTPSSTNGNRLSAGMILSLAGYQKVSQFRMLRNGSSDAVVDISYYKE